jgi:hypothetical protein
MDDPQKPASLVPTKIKEHAKPVLYGVAANAVTQILVLGVPAVIAWVAAHKAIASGIPLHWAILIASVVLFLLAMTANYIKVLLQGRQVVTTPHDVVDSNLLARFSGKRQQVKSLQAANAKLTGDLAEANIGKLAAKNERDGLQNRISELTIKLGTAEANHTLAVENLNSKLDEKIKEIKTSKRETEAQRNRADSEVHDKSLVRELKNRAEAELADLAFLKELAKRQASDLSTYVRTEILTHPHCGELQLTGKHLCILLAVSIQNESVFDIAIEEKQITGQFSLDRVALKEQAGQLIDDFRPPLHDLNPRQRETILIEQPLLAFEAEKIERFLADDPEAKFSVGALGIPISINNAGFSATNAPFLRFRSGEVPLKCFKRNTDIA